MTKHALKTISRSLGLLIIAATFLAGPTACIVVRDRTSSRPAAVHKHGKHQHRHCHSRPHKKHKKHKQQCHNHPHGHPHH